jgi:hypothetical protein
VSLRDGPVGFRSTRPWPSVTAARRHDEVRALVEGEVATDGLPILDWSYEHVTSWTWKFGREAMCRS